MRIAVAIDNWKLQIFEKHLKAAGYGYEKSGQFTKDTMILTVHATSALDVEKMCRAANAECRAARAS